MHIYMPTSFFRHGLHGLHGLVYIYNTKNRVNPCNPCQIITTYTKNTYLCINGKIRSEHIRLRLRSPHYPT